MDLGYCGPIQKKIKLTCTMLNCSICSTKIFTTNSPDNYSNNKVYSKLLIRYLIPVNSPSDWSNIISNSFIFCLRCTKVLEELKELDDLIENTKNCIKSKVTTIKVSILKNKLETEDDSIISNFRRLVVKDFQPFVKLAKLKLPTLATKLKKQSGITARKKIKSHVNTTPVPKALICEVKTEVTPRDVSKFEDTSVFSLSDISMRSEMVTCEPRIKMFDFLEDVVKFEPWNEVEQNLSFDPLNESIESNTSLDVNCSTDYSIDISSTFQDAKPCTENLPTRATVPAPEEKIWSKPPLTMTQFAILAIKNGPRGGMVVHDIMNFISENFPYYRSAENWKFLVRNALSLNPCFVRNIEANSTYPTPSASMAGRWTLDEARITDAFKMKIVESCSEKYVAYPERLHNMLQPLLVANYPFSDSQNENMGPQFLERQIYPTNEVIMETNTSEMRYVTETQNQNDFINPPIANADFSQMERLFGNEERYVNMNQPLVQPLYHYLPTSVAEKQWLKPKMKYHVLAFVAIMNLSGQEGTLRDICQFISDNYPYFKTDQRLETAIYTAMNCSRYFLAKPVMYQAKLVKWTVNYDKIKFMLNIVADSVKEDIASNCMAYPERLNEILRPLFANALSCDHLFFVTLKSSPIETLSADEIYEYLLHNFYPFCNQNGLNSYNIFESLERSLFFTLNSQMRWSIIDVTKERIKKEIQYMLTTSPDTLRRALTNNEMITLFIAACS